MSRRNSPPSSLGVQRRPVVTQLVTQPEGQRLKLTSGWLCADLEVYLARALVSPSLPSPLLSAAAPPGGVGASNPRTSPDRTSRRPCFTDHRLTSHYHPATSDPGPADHDPLPTPSVPSRTDGFWR